MKKTRQNYNQNLTIIGAGTAGIMLAHKLKHTGLSITIIDPAEHHFYQPGFLFIPFGKYSLKNLRRPISELLPKGVRHVKESVESIDFDGDSLKTNAGKTISYDTLVIATGTHVDHSMTPGLTDSGWKKDIFDFYTPDGAMALREKLDQFKKGKIVVQIMDMPIKCPVAPLEFAFLADDFFKNRGLRDNVQIEYVTSLSGAFTKPVASEKLGHILADKNIDVTADFYVEKVDSDNNKLICYDGREVTYDLLVTVPVNVGADFLKDLDITDELGFVEVNHHSLQSTEHSNVFAVGDAANLPTSKAGSTAHFEIDTLCENILRQLDGEPLEETFDGHANCFVELGQKKALLLDFNYETQPLEGTFPFAGFGPLKLLKPTRLNHLGKLAFRYIYWYLLLPGRNIPFIHAKMSLKGKKQPQNERVNE